MAKTTRNSTKRRVTRVSRKNVEICWVLLGARRGRIWYARRARRTVGEPLRVEFDGPAALRREEKFGDVIGFLHTHPAGPPRPSDRDVRTMRAWCSAFGKPLLCAIAAGETLAGYVFKDHRSKGLAASAIELFPRGVLVCVEDSG